MTHKKGRGNKNASVKSKFKSKTAQNQDVRDHSPSPSTAEHESPAAKDTRRVRVAEPAKEAERESPSTALSVPDCEMPDHPSDNLEGSLRLGLHSAYSNELEVRLNQLETDYNNTVTSTRELLNQLEVDYTNAVASTRELLDHIAEWKEAWGSGQ
ncbi:hypothetical protein N7456_003512 [Penicillium angulare]|uniref:Uncharacterized protein n=1 Tax=Penicillium angulare TaxID=116970 RepID=A0A9W9FWJ8_9EURO|nr:hypothetical protein N7456_003512 [Penicillium angulare]